ncbi:phosphodiesterase [Methylomonas sp. LWB]|uniref:phosphodiesterase n=1 Tax=Methylomonas sp. LWB TaxID=1905845 RepID=UPI0008DA5188|nr:phosphodiesterase [Methylomonas sp. LWB]OHX36172.1 phosphodiesterase [Methylomonas sp. LWB]
MRLTKVLQLTDLHLRATADGTMLGVDTEFYFRETLNRALAAHGPFDLILLTGDLTQDPCPDSYRRLAGILAAYDTPCLCLPGNHDDPNLMRLWLAGGSVDCGRRIALPGWQIIALNSRKPGSPAGFLSESELAEAAELLTANPEPALLAVHHHTLPCGGPWMDRMKIENGDALIELTSRFRQIKAVTSGHVHQLFEADRSGVRWLGMPATCFQFKPGADKLELDPLPPGYRVFELSDDGQIFSSCHRLDIEQPELELQADY